MHVTAEFAQKINVRDTTTDSREKPRYGILCRDQQSSLITENDNRASLQTECVSNSQETSVSGRLPNLSSSPLDGVPQRTFTLRRSTRLSKQKTLGKVPNIVLCNVRKMSALAPDPCLQCRVSQSSTQSIKCHAISWSSSAISTADTYRGTKRSLIPKTRRDLSLSMIHKRNKFGETLLHLAVMDEDEKLVKDMLQIGASVNIPDNAGWTPLHEAVATGHHAIVVALIQAGAVVNCTGDHGVTPLHDAICLGNYQIAELLLNSGADPFQKNMDGKSALGMTMDDSLTKLLERFVPRTKNLFPAHGRSKCSNYEESSSRKQCISPSLVTNVVLQSTRGSVRKRGRSGQPSETNSNLPAKSRSMAKENTNCRGQSERTGLGQSGSSVMPAAKTMKTKIEEVSAEGEMIKPRKKKLDSTFVNQKCQSITEWKSLPNMQMRRRAGKGTISVEGEQQCHDHNSGKKAWDCSGSSLYSCEDKVSHESMAYNSEQTTENTYECSISLLASSTKALQHPSFQQCHIGIDTCEVQKQSYQDFSDSSTKLLNSEEIKTNYKGLSVSDLFRSNTVGLDFSPLNTGCSFSEEHSQGTGELGNMHHNNEIQFEKEGHLFLHADYKTSAPVENMMEAECNHHLLKSTVCRKSMQMEETTKCIQNKLSAPSAVPICASACSFPAIGMSDLLETDFGTLGNLKYHQGHETVVEETDFIHCLTVGEDIPKEFTEKAMLCHSEIIQCCSEFHDTIFSKATDKSSKTGISNGEIEHRDHEKRCGKTSRSHAGANTNEEILRNDAFCNGHSEITATNIQKDTPHAEDDAADNSFDSDCTLISESAYVQGRSYGPAVELQNASVNSSSTMYSIYSADKENDKHNHAYINSVCINRERNTDAVYAAKNLTSQNNSKRKRNTLRNKQQHRATSYNKKSKKQKEKSVFKELQRSVNVPFKNIYEKNSHGESPLLLASKKGDLALVKALISAGISVNQADQSGWTPLHEACNLGHIAILEELLQAGADVSSHGYGGIIPLHDAVTSNNFKAVQLLLQYGSDPEITDESGKNSYNLVHDEAIRKLLSSFQRPFVGKSNSTARARTPAAICSFCTDDKITGVCNSKKQCPYKFSSTILEEVEKKNEIQASNFTEPEAAETPVGDTEPKQGETVKDSGWLISLIQKGIIKPGNNIFKLKLKGFCHTASLQQNGSIKDVRGQVYVSPQAWVQSLFGTDIPDSPAFAWKKVMYRSKSLSKYFMKAHPPTSGSTKSQQKVSATPPETVKKDSYISSFMSINRILLINDDEFMPSCILEHYWDELLYLDDWIS